MMQIHRRGTGSFPTRTAMRREIANRDWEPLPSHSDASAEPGVALIFCKVINRLPVITTSREYIQRQQVYYDVRSYRSLSPHLVRWNTSFQRLSCAKKS